MSVCRNNGYCWGRVTVPDSSEQFEVFTRKDWYDYPDEEAADAFVRAARNPKCVEKVAPQ